MTDTDPIFQSVEKPRLSQEVARQLLQAIQEGHFLPGEALPPERELARKFNVSRPILREALSILEIQGYISAQHGRGTFVKDPNTDILNVPLEDWLSKNGMLVQHFYEARLAIEPLCAALAAQRAQPPDIAELREIMLREDSLVDSGNVPMFIRNDIDFHSAIARLSGNAYLVKMLNSLIIPETDIRKIILRLPSHQPVTHSDHFRVFAAIEKHKPDAARRAMVIALQRPLDVVRNFMSRQEPNQ